MTTATRTGQADAEREHAGSERPAPDDAPREVDLEEILCGERGITIRHAGARYTLRLTRQNKLLLTK